MIAETNHEILCPLYHGEVYTIKKLSEQSDRPKPEAREDVQDPNGMSEAYNARYIVIINVYCVYLRQPSC